MQPLLLSKTMSRRRMLGGAVALAVARASMAAEQGSALPMPPGGRPWRIGWLLISGDAALQRRVVDAFHAAMRERGWQTGRHYTIDERSSGGDSRRFPALAAELVASSPDVLIGVETTAKLLRQHTTTIPIVLWASLDPVAAGLVQSLARPGTNVTGVSNVADGLQAKNAEALFEIVPRARRVALLYDPNWAAADRTVAVVGRVAQVHGAQLLPLAVTADASSVQAAIAAIDRERAEGLMIANNAALMVGAAAIAAAIRARRLPASGNLAAGAVASHAVDLLANVREAADFVDRIFRGAKPADLPVRQIMSVKVTVDARRAREIGVALPASLLLRADEVIE